MKNAPYAYRRYVIETRKTLICTLKTVVDRSYPFRLPPSLGPPNAEIMPFEIYIRDQIVLFLIISQFAITMVETLHMAFLPTLLTLPRLVRGDAVRMGGC